MSRCSANLLSVAPNEEPMIAATHLVSLLESFYISTRRNTVKPLLWVVEGRDLTICLPALKTLGRKRDFDDIRLVIVWIVPDSIDQALKDSAAELLAWSQQVDTILATTLVIQHNSRLAETMRRSQFNILYRSIAALLGGGMVNPEANFATLTIQLHNAGYPFVALAAGAIGVNASHSNFTNGLIVGNRGDINPIDASFKVNQLASMALRKESELSTVTESLSAVPFVNLVVPTRLQMTREFQSEVSHRLRFEYGVPSENVIVTPLTDPRDRGIDISRQNRWFKGDFYIHFTALRGIGTGHGEIPKDLQGEVSL